MSTVASLQIKIGADVSAAISGLSRAEFAADQVKEAYIAANDATIKGGFAIAGWSQNFSTAISAVKRDLEQVDITKLDEGSKESSANMLALATGALRVSETVTVAASAFSGMQSIAGPAIAGIARLIPSIGVSLAALAGPIGIAVGVLAAGAAIVVSNWDLVAGAVSNVETVTIAANKATQEQKAKTLELVDVLKNEVSTRNQQAAAIKQLNEISPTYFGGLTKEKATVDQLNVAYTKYAANLDNIAKLQAINNEVSALYQQQVSTQIALQNATASATQEQLKYNSAAASAREGTKNELPLTLAKNTVAAETQKLGVINAQIAKYKELANTIPAVTREPELAGKGGKGIESALDKQKNALADFAKAIEIIQVKNKEGLLPDAKVYDAQVDAIYNTIEKLAGIDVNSDIFKQFVDEAKSFFNQQQVNIDVVPRVLVDNVASLTPVAPLADRMKALAEEKLSGIRITIDDTGALTAAEKFAESVKKAIDGVQNVTGQAGNIADAVFGFNQATIDKKSQELDNFYSESASKIERSSAPEEVKAKKLEELDKSVAQKRKAIAREQAAAAKKTSVFEALVNTANAVTKALTAGPIAGPILAAVIGSLGAAQVAAIAATPLPALAAGGLVSGPNTVLVGEYPGANNNPELISPVDKVKKYIVEAVNSTRGTVSQQGQWKLSGIDLYLGTQYAQDYYSRLR